MAMVKFRLAARCEAAGRMDNEDNYQISENLSEGKWSFTTDEEVDLSQLGVLLVVADGMGGLNAGEIASALAIETVKEWFSPENLSKETFKYPSQIKSYIKKTIQAADQRIKSAGEKDKSISGMGSTIVLAWIIDNYVYVGWCGDSRAYRYNPADGFIQLSHDHSYVQELVDKGKLQPELAFDFPDRNIITRSLGDTRRKANPDILDFPLHNGDLFLLCSDGLSGVLRDEQLAEIIAANSNSLLTCRDALWKASFEAEWDDNVTFILCQILSGIEVEKQENTLKIVPQEEKPAEIVKYASPKNGKWKIWLVVVAIIFAIAASAYYSLKKGKSGNENPPIVNNNSMSTPDTTMSIQGKTPSETGNSNKTNNKIVDKTKREEINTITKEVKPNSMQSRIYGNEDSTVLKNEEMDSIVVDINKESLMRILHENNIDSCYFTDIMKLSFLEFYLKNKGLTDYIVDKDNIIRYKKFMKKQ